MAQREERKPILLTGFEPFGRHRTNSSWEAVRIAGAALGPAAHVACLPVHHHHARERLLSLLHELQPPICLLTGLATGSAVRIERQARKPSEFDGLSGTTRMSGHWPWREMHRAVRRVFSPVRFSDDAGGYVCESTYWSLLAHRSDCGVPGDAAFVHFPPLSRRASAETLANVLLSILDEHRSHSRRRPNAALGGRRSAIIRHVNASPRPRGRR